MEKCFDNCYHTTHILDVFAFIRKQTRKQFKTLQTLQIITELILCFYDGAVCILVGKGDFLSQPNDMAMFHINRIHNTII